MIRRIGFALLLTGSAACLATAPVKPVPVPVPPPVVVTPPPVVVPPADPPFPDPPTRDQVLSAHLTFQGLTVQSAQYGALPWFEAALVSLSPEDRQAVYAAKRAAGDTAAILAVSWGYSEPGQPYAAIPGADFSTHLADFVRLVEEAIQAGFTPRVFLGGDDGERGYPIAQAQLPAVLRALATSTAGDLTRYVVIVPGWDGVFYGWTPEHIAAFGQQFRTLAPNGYLGIEHNQGHIPIGNGPADYAPGGPMQAYDVVYGEFNNWPTTGDVVWQVLGRMLGPAYRRDPVQPPGDDPSPPWYLRASTPRGPIYYDCFEYAEFDWVRSRVTAAQIAEARAYYRARGCPIVD